MAKSSYFLIVAVLAGLYQNSAKIDRWFNPPPPKTPGSDEVILYSTTWCGYCAKTRQYFEENKIDYIDLDIEHSDEGRDDYQRMGGGGVPIVVINEETVIRGYAPGQISAALNP